MLVAAVTFLVATAVQHAISSEYLWIIVVVCLRFGALSVPGSHGNDAKTKLHYRRDSVQWYKTEILLDVKLGQVIDATLIL
jgi:hypothetical protein